MAYQVPSAERATDRIRKGADERKCEWVLFPDKKRYMLPVVTRQQKTVPVFDEDGFIVPKVIPNDPELSELVEKFLLLTASVGNQFEATANAYGAFVRLVRALILTNYERTDEEIAQLLTLTNQQLSWLWSAILLHVVQQ